MRNWAGDRRGRWRARRRERPDFEPPRCGGRERPPYGPGETRRPPGKMQPPRCTVGADSISARFAAARGLREGHAPPLHAVRERPAKWACRGRPGERRAGCPHPAAPCGKAGFRGRDKSRPYGQILCFRQIGRPRCLPRFAGEVRGKAGRADMESAPTWGVCGGAGFPGRCEHRPLHTFAIMQGPRFPARRGHRRRS